MKSSNAKIRKLCLWVTDHGGSEPTPQGDPAEREAYGILNYRRKLLRRGQDPLQEGDVEILAEYGLQGMLSSEGRRETLSNEKTSEICRLVLETGTEPRYDTELGAWLLRRREGRARVYPSDARIADAAGCPNLFDPLDMEGKSNALAIMYCSWRDEHPGHLPSTVSKDELERQVALWVVNKKKAFLGNGSTSVYPSDTRILRDRGYLTAILG